MLNINIFISLINTIRSLYNKYYFITYWNVGKLENFDQKSDLIDKKYRELFNNSVNGIAIHKVVYNSNKKPINYVITNVNPQFESPKKLYNS